MKERRYDLDWLRVLVFGLLILYHVGMVFVPWDYHIKNNHISEGLIYPMLLVNQWRLPALFLISGMGTRFALSYRSGNQFIKERFSRLVIPLIFGTLVIVSPQIYYERLAQGQLYGSFIEFYPDFFKGIYPSGNFSWNHLWFLPYLFVFSLILTPFFLYIRSNPQGRFIGFIGKLIAKPLGLFWLIIPLVLVQYCLGPLFPVTRNLFYDWYALTFYLLFFVYGFLFIAVKDVFWLSLERIRFTALLLALFLFPLRLISHDTLLQGLVYVINIWCWLLAIFGYAAKYLNKNSPALHYANRAVYPFYILHQTFIVVAAYYMRNLDWTIGVKFFLLTLVTFAGSWLVYELLIRRIKFLGPIFGLK